MPLLYNEVFTVVILADDASKAPRMIAAMSDRNNWHEQSQRVDPATNNIVVTFWRPRGLSGS